MRTRQFIRWTPAALLLALAGGLSAQVAPTADLAITKTGPASVTAGLNVVYTVTITNNGPSPAAVVSVADPTPAGLTFVSNTGGCVTAYPCALGTLAVNQVVTITTTYSVPGNYAAATISNTATVSAQTADPVAGNNTATAVTPVTTSADLSIAKFGFGTVLQGTTTNYSISVNNAGPSTAAAVTVTDVLPANTTFVSATPTQGTCTGTTTVTCNLGAIDSTLSAFITLVVQVNSGPTVVNTATVRSTTADPVAANNSATATTNVIPPFTCNASAKAAPVRGEGSTELVADVVLTCTGGFPTIDDGVQIPQMDVGLSFNANVSSRILGAGGASEALLLLDEPAPGAQFPCDQPTGICIGFGNDLGFGYYGAGPGNNRNVFQGLVNASTASFRGTAQTIVWPSVPIDPSGSGTRIYRFTNLRLDATKAGTLQALVTFTGGSGPIVNNVPVVVATAQTSLSATVHDASAGAALPFGITIPLGINGSSLNRYATLRFAGTFAAADRPRTVAAYAGPDASPAPVNQSTPGSANNSESGFYNNTFGTFGPGGNLGTAGLADTGTRYMAVFTNIPAGFAVYVDLYNSTFNSGPTARLVNTDANGAGPFSVSFGNGLLVQLPVTNGTATAVWEVLRGSGNTTDQFDFGVYLAFAPGITVIPPSVGVQMRYAPIRPALSIPLFATASTVQNLFTFVTPPGLVVSPNAMSFSGTAGGRNPAAQSLTVLSTSNVIPVPFTMGSSGVLPIQFQPQSSVTPDSVSVSVNIQGMAAGTYRDTINAFALNGNATASIPVSLTLFPGPQITSLSPSAVLSGGPAFTLTVNGSGFSPGTVVRWNGLPLGTAQNSSGSMTAQVPAALIAAPTLASITAITLDGSVSNTVPFAVSTFTITAINPSTVTAGGNGFDLTISGTGFVAGDTVNVGGSVLQVASLTASQIVVTVPPNIIAQPGTLPVTVASPAGLLSNSVNLTVVPPFRLDTISPAAVTATGPAFTLTLTGVGFATGATVQVGGTTLQPVSLTATQITAAIPTSLIAKPGSLPVTVTNAGGAVSNALSLVVNAGPSLTAINPSSATAGSAGVSLTATGTNFPNGAVVRWNGQALSTQFVSTTQLTATVPAGLLASPGIADVTVATADGVVSNSLPFTINPRPTITSLGPSSATLGGAAFTLTVNGTNLPNGSVVRWNGQSLSTTFGSAAQVSAQVPASLLAAAGTATITVTTPDGVSTNSLPFTINLPALTGVSVTAPPTSASGQDQTVTIKLGTFPVDLVCTVTLTFAGDGGLPDDPAIQFQNQSRVFTFTVPAGTPANPPQLIVKTGTTAGVITITTTFTAGGGDVTPAGTVPQRIQVARSAPSISSVSCPRNATGFTVTVDGFTNTREATQATFDFQAAAGSTLGTSQLVATVTALFTAYFGGSASTDQGGVFRYTQPFSVSGSSTSIVSVSVRLGNSAGTSATVTCQLQ